MLLVPSEQVEQWLVMKVEVPALAAVAAGAFVIYRHSSNIKRLRDGTENVFKL